MATDIPSEMLRLHVVISSQVSPAWVMRRTTIDVAPDNRQSTVLRALQIVEDSLEKWLASNESCPDAEHVGYPYVSIYLDITALKGGHHEV